MKKLIKYLLFLFISSQFTFSQEYTSVKFLNLDMEIARDAANQTFKDLKLPNMYLWKNQNSAESALYTYTSLMVKNRFVFSVVLESNTLTIAIVKRQYFINNHWEDNPLPMSKKQAAKILDPIEEKFNELIKTNTTNVISKSNIENQEALQNKTGIYEDFVIVKTEDPEMELLALHKNGNLIGYNLSDDKSNIKSLTFKENELATPVTLLFNEDESPKGIIFSNYVIKFLVQKNKATELLAYDNNGNFINKSTIKFEDLNSFSTKIIQEKNGQGPNLASIIFENNEKSLATKLGYASTTLQVALCGGLILTGAGAPVAAVVCGSALLDLTVRFLPKENFLYDTLAIASMATGFIPIGNPLKFATLITSTANLSQLLAGLTSIASGAESLFEKHFTEDEIIIEGPSSIETGYFGEKGKPIIMYAKSNNKNLQIEWESSTESIIIDKIGPNDTRNKEGYSAIQVWAIAPSSEKPMIIASLAGSKNEVIEYKELEVKSPNYLYFLDCKECGKYTQMNSQLKEKIETCKKQLEICKNKTTISKDILLIVNSSNEVIEPKLNETQLKFIKKIVKNDGTPYPISENGEFKEFVKEASCNFNCEGFDDKQTIILLAHEAMNKIEINEEKIKTLQKSAENILLQSQNANDERFLKIANDIKSVEESTKKIKAEYGEKINKIAQKGTIEFMHQKTDKSQCYNIQGSIRTKGAHWSRPFLTILLEYDFIPNSCEEKSEYGVIFKGKGVSRITYNFNGEGKKVISKAASSIAQFKTITMDIEEFKETILIIFFKSNPIGIFNQF